MRTLASLLVDVPNARVHGDPHTPVASLVADSREVVPHSMFFALPGTRADGVAFVDEAVRRGATVVVAPRMVPVPECVTVVVVDDPRQTLARVASSFWGHPERRMTLVGVTGTDGKTSVAYLAARMLSACGRRAGYIGTLGVHLDDLTRPIRHTTPPPPELHAILAWLRDNGADAASLEASSHSLDQGRLLGLPFAVAVFTTFGRDHLDYHRSQQDYLEAKLKLFDGVSPDGWAVVNAAYPRIVDAVRSRGYRVLTFGARDARADLQVLRCVSSLEGTNVVLACGDARAALRSPLVGAFQGENLAAACTVGLALGLPLHDVVRGLATVRRIPGRFEPVSCRGMVWAVVDYAHTPQALDKALASARMVARGRVLVVFGCGGDRDPGKRPLMGAVASRSADLVIVTSDNPRSEDPLAIIDAIVHGMDGPAEVIVEPQRREALRRAAALWRQGDLVLVAGKGHERTQTIGTTVLSFDDVEELSALIPDALRDGLAQEEEHPC